MILPSENNLKEDLLNVAGRDHLPTWAELEPGSVLYAIDRVWEQDKPKKLLSQKKIAEEIENILGRKYTHNQYKAMFRSGRKSVIPKDIAEAYLQVAFNKWTFRGTDQSHNSFQKIFPDKNLKELNKIIQSICDLIYKDTETVHCKPPEGIGPNGFYTNCREADRSVIIAAQNEHIVQSTPIRDLTLWSNHINNFFKDLDKIKSQRIHVWVFRHPISLDENEVIQSAYDIGFLKTAFSTARMKCLNGKMALDWREFSKRCVVIIPMKTIKGKTNKENPISEKLIFPKNISSLVVTAKKNEEDKTELGYNQISANKTKPALSKINSLSRKNNESYENLFLCAQTYSTKVTRSSQKKMLNSAINNGWSFMTAEEFLDFKIL